MGGGGVAAKANRKSRGPSSAEAPPSWRNLLGSISALMDLQERRSLRVHQPLWPRPSWEVGRSASEQEMEK